MPLADVIGRIPGLAGYEAARLGNRQLEMQELGQAGQVMGLQAALEERNRREQALQRENAFRQELSALGPNPSQEQLTAVGAKYADPKTLLTTMQSSQDKQMQIQATAEARRERLAQTEQYANMMHEWRMANARTAEERAAEQARHNQAQEGLNAQLAASNAELRKMGFEIQRQGQQLQLARLEQQQTQAQAQNVQQLSTALDRANLPEADAVLRLVEDSLAKVPDLAAYLNGPGSLVPDMAVSDAVKAGRQAFQKLFNITLKNRSGAAVTIPEFERLKAEFATGVFKTPEQIKKGVEQARKIISDHYRGVAAGFDSKVLDTYNANLRATGGTPLLEPRGDGGGKEDPLGIRK